MNTELELLKNPVHTFFGIREWKQMYTAVFAKIDVYLRFYSKLWSDSICYVCRKSRQDPTDTMYHQLNGCSEIIPETNNTSLSVRQNLLRKQPDDNENVNGEMINSDTIFTQNISGFGGCSTYYVLHICITIFLNRYGGGKQGRFFPFSLKTMLFIYGTHCIYNILNEIKSTNKKIIKLEKNNPPLSVFQIGIGKSVVRSTYYTGRTK